MDLQSVESFLCASDRGEHDRHPVTRRIYTSQRPCRAAIKRANALFQAARGRTAVVARNVHNNIVRAFEP